MQSHISTLIHRSLTAWSAMQVTMVASDGTSVVVEVLAWGACGVIEGPCHTPTLWWWEGRSGGYWRSSEVFTAGDLPGLRQTIQGSQSLGTP